MKKVLYFIFTCFSIAASAQAVLNKTHFAVAGDTLFYGHDTTSSNSNLNSTSGANKTWNFSTANKMYFSESVFAPLEASPIDVPADVTHLLIEKMLDEEETYTFMNVTPTKVEMLNDGGEMLGSEPVRIKTLSFPLTYNTKVTDSTQIVQIFPAAILGSEVSALADSIRLTVKVKITNLCDGYGTLTTPTASYNNTLRLKVTSVLNFKLEGKKNLLGFWIPLPSDILPIPGNQTDVSFVWLDENSKYFLAEASMETENPDRMISFYYQIPRSAATGILKQAKNQFDLNVFPNPVNDLVNFEFNAKQNNITTIELTDMTGRIVASKVEFVTAGKHKSQLNVAQLKSGYYFVNITQNGQTAKHKLVIQH